TTFSTQMISWHSEHLPKRWLALSISILGPSHATLVNSGVLMFLSLPQAGPERKRGSGELARASTTQLEQKGCPTRAMKSVFGSAADWTVLPAWGVGP